MLKANSTRLRNTTANSLKKMNEEEKRIRKLIVDTILSKYPHTKSTYEDFLEGKVKPTVDSWAGDIFATLRLKPYEYWRSVLFCD